MPIHDLGGVATDVDGVCALYATLHEVTFDKGDPALGGARVAIRAMEIPGYGTCAVVIQGGAELGLWQP